jgi:hypothetical protein
MAALFLWSSTQIVDQARRELRKLQTANDAATTSRLGVEPQQVVLGESEAADRWFGF